MAARAGTELRGRLAAALAPLIRRGAPLDLDQVPRGDLTFVHCRLGDGASRQDAADLRRTIAGVVGAWIVERNEPERLERMVGMRYPYLDVDERRRITLAAQGRLAAAPAPGPVRRQRITQRVHDYLERTQTLVIEGFCTFRLQDEQSELMELVEQVADGVLAEREYQEFVALLRHVVESQPLRSEEIHCSFDAHGGLSLRDAQGEDVGRHCLEDLTREAAVRGLGVEDLLVSALITLAPRQLCLHLPGGAGGAVSPDTLGILRAVFESHLAVCAGCGRCQPAE